MAIQLAPLADSISLLFTLIFQKPGEFVYTYFTTYSRPILNVLHTIFDTAFYVILGITVALTLLFLVLSIITRFKKPTKEKVIKDDALLPIVTIQIPTYNELAALNCATRCLAFDYPK
ncbi:MAG: hypothetical protein KC535_03055, partial [Nanoarchaeota archaeon]|nr:hypothetical protein [Nanoarchaeota archaeon]